MKNPLKKRENVNFEKKYKCFFIMFQRSLNPKIRFLGQTVCSEARPQTHRKTDRHT